MARLFADEDFTHGVALELRKLGHDVVRTQEVGLANLKTPDHVILATAAQDQRAVLTLDRWHFKKLHQLDSNHGGIIACTRDRNWLALAQRIHDAILREQPLAGKLILA
jgi:hypothetical protein